MSEERLTLLERIESMLAQRAADLHPCNHYTGRTEGGDTRNPYLSCAECSRLRRQQINKDKDLLAAHMLIGLPVLIPTE